MSPPRPVREELEGIFRDALAAVDPAARLRELLVRDGGALRIGDVPLPSEARLRVLAAGKAAAPMAAAVEEWAGERIAAGVAVVPDGYGLSLRRIALLEAAHPIPDARSLGAARRALELAAACAPQEWLLVLLSGGASSLWCAPAADLGLDDLAATTRALLAAGCDIEETNAVRKHLSAIAGGRLALASPAGRVCVLALSDVPGDRVEVLGSGPCAADPTRYADALAALEGGPGRDRVPSRVIAHLEAGVRGEHDETPKPGDPRLARVEHRVLAGNGTAIAAALRSARERGWQALRASDSLAGEARRAGRRLAGLARSLHGPQRVCAVAGGETTVRVAGAGRGGRSQELALAAALELDGCPRIALLAAGTDGRDGPTDAAGAHADGDTLRRARALGLDAERALRENDSYGFFSAEGGLFRTGPTRTNVMDLVLVAVNSGVPGASKTG